MIIDREEIVCTCCGLSNGADNSFSRLWPCSCYVTRKYFSVSDVDMTRLYPPSLPLKRAPVGKVEMNVVPLSVRIVTLMVHQRRKVG